MKLSKKEVATGHKAPLIGTVGKPHVRALVRLLKSGVDYSGQVRGKIRAARREGAYVDMNLGNGNVG